MLLGKEIWLGTIRSAIESSIETKRKLLEDLNILSSIQAISRVMIDACKQGNKVLFCGNGGSAADAQHLAAEFTGRFYFDRAPLFAEALHVNTSYLTAVANDYSYEEVYSRLVEAKGREGDVLVGLSTSGNSKNVVKALEKANELGLVTVSLVGALGGSMQDVSQYTIGVPSKDTPRIQECHILLGHILCEIVEKEIFGLEKRKEESILIGSSHFSGRSRD